MNFELEPRTIYITAAGSQVYGFATPESDWDYRGICIPPLDMYIGIQSKFEQIVDSSKHTVYQKFTPGLLKDDPRITPGAIGPDIQIMELSKFVQLAANANPSIIEILFTNPKFHVISHPIMRRLFDNKELFLTTKVRHSFHGYAVAQLKRITKHKKWLDNPPKKAPTREEFGLPELKVNIDDQMGAAYALIDRQICDISLSEELSKKDLYDIKKAMSEIVKSVWDTINNKEFPIGENKQFENFDDALFFGKAFEQGFPPNLLELLSREKRYRAAKAHWDSFQVWKKERNPKRAALEAKFSYDTKNACHIVRLIRTCNELLETGKVNVTRADAKELLEIRNGSWSLDRLMAFIEDNDKRSDELAMKSRLPKKPDLAKIQDITYEMIMEFNNDFTI